MRGLAPISALPILGIALAGCPTTPPGLRMPTLGSATEGDAASTDAGSSADDVSETGDLDAFTSTDTDGSGESTGETGEGDDAGAGIFAPSCWSSPTLCSAPSEFTGPGECDPYAQDCPEGEKCVPVAEGGQWTSTVCRPVADDPAAAAEPCAIEGAPGSGLDDCDVGLLCRSSDGGLSGRCRELCGCGPVDPTCNAPGLLCVASADLFGLCLPSCDPLQQDCVAPDGCYASGDVGFVCAAAASPMATVAGDPCEAANGCSPGQICVGAEAVPGCGGQVGCCADLCDAEGDADCAADRQCVALWGGMPPAPDCPENVGVCVELAR